MCMSFLVFLIAQVINIDARDKDTGDTALMWAVRNRHVKIIQLLLKYGADVTLRNSSNETVLELANDYEIRRILVESVLRNGVSPRHLLQAAWQGNIDVVKHLLVSVNTLILIKKNTSWQCFQLRNLRFMPKSFILYVYIYRVAPQKTEQ